MSVRDELFAAFAEKGPDAHTASEWAEEFDTGTDYVYKLRSEFKNDPDLGVDDDRADHVDEDPGPDREPETTLDPDPDPDDGADPTPDDGADPTPDDGETSDPEPVDGTESVGVKHEGSEKLSPDGHEDESVSSVDMPEGLEHLEDRSPEDFEPDEGASPDPEPQGKDTEDPAADPDPAPDSGESGGDDGGLLSRLRGSDDGQATDQTAEEVVDDAPTEEERERRADLLGQLEQRSGVEDDQADDDDSPDPSPESGSEPDPQLSPGANGLHMDEELMATMFGLPFNQAANATGWDGWQLSEEEKQANAELLVAYCQEQNIDVSTGGMLAMSLLSTVGGRAAGYARHRKQQSDTPQSGQQAPAEAPSSDPDPQGEGAEDTDAAPDTQPERQPHVPDTGDSEPVEATEDAQSDDFDFSDSSTW